MQRFFDNFNSIDCFTLSLDYHQDKLQCAHCLKHDQLVSHGIIYKQRSMDTREPVGKRLFCSNRYGRSGCGRTVQLFISTQIPNLHYSTLTVCLFISLLLTQVCITQAYQQATGQFEARNAWRWLAKLIRQLSAYRSSLWARTKPLTTPVKSKRLGLLLPTFAEMINQSATEFCSRYQLNYQRSFI